jgi:hypothetical protein
VAAVAAPRAPCPHGHTANDPARRATVIRGARARRGTRCADTPAMATIKIDAALELPGTSLTRFFAGPVSVTFPGL